MNVKKVNKPNNIQINDVVITHLLFLMLCIICLIIVIIFNKYNENLKNEYIPYITCCRKWKKT